jgi:hypothetical protein
MPSPKTLRRTMVSDALLSMNELAMYWRHFAEGDLPRPRRSGSLGVPAVGLRYL